MREDKLQEIIELLPYSIRYSGEIEELLDYAKEQAELVQELEEERDEWKYTAQSYYMTNQELREQNKHYRQVLAFYANKDNYKDMALFDDETMYDEDGLMANEQEYAPPAIYYDNGEKARQALEGEE